MTASIPTTVTVIDFRRQSLLLEWNAVGGTWTACDVPPPLAHGIALIRASQPNFCIYATGNELHLQVGAERWQLGEQTPRVNCTRGVASFGFRKRFSIESSDGGILFKHSFWTGQGDEFFRWLAARAADPQWRAETGPRWSAGVEPAVLRAG
jgi:hypothetical protein